MLALEFLIDDRVELLRFARYIVNALGIPSLSIASSYRSPSAPIQVKGGTVATDS